MAYTGSNITGCNSPALGNDRNTYAAIFDLLAQRIDEHDHVVGGSRGLQIPTAGLADLSVTTAKIDDLSVTTAKLAALNVTTAKIADLNVTTAKIADLNVTTAKLADANVTQAKMANDSVGTAQLIAANVTLAKMANNSVGTSQLVALSVTQAKREALNIITAGGTGSFSSANSASWVNVLSVVITSTGRPIFVGVHGIDGYLGAFYTDTGIGGIRVLHNGSVVRGKWSVGTSVVPASPWTIVQTVADTHTFALQVIAPVGGTIFADGMELLTYEL